MADDKLRALGDERLRDFLKLARVARLATCDHATVPHNISICFWFDEVAHFYFVIDRSDAYFCRTPPASSCPGLIGMPARNCATSNRRWSVSLASSAARSRLGCFASRKLNCLVGVQLVTAKGN